MTVYVDDAFIPAKVGRLDTVWCHMTADSDEELHAMAEAIGMKRRWAQKLRHPNPWHHHYDLVPSRREAAIKAGAVPITTDEWAAKSRAWRESQRDSSV